MNSLVRHRTYNLGESYPKKRQYQSFIIACFVSSVSLLIAILIGFLQYDKGIYKFIFFIPLIYGCLNLMFFSIYDRKSLFKYVILSLMFLRYVVGPLSIYLERFPTNLYDQVFSEDIIVQSTFLMCYEMSCLFVVLWIFERKKRYIATDKKQYDFLSGKNFGKINPLLMAMIIITTAMYAKYPALFHYYYFIFDKSIQETTILNAQEIQASIPNGLRWIGYTLGEITHYTVLTKIIAMMYKRYEKKPRNIYIYVAILIVILNATITTSRQMSGLIMSAVLYMQIIRMFPRKRKMLFNISIVSASALITTLIVSYFTLSISYHTISSIVEAYTNGFYGIYQSLESFTSVKLGFFEKCELLFVGDTLGFVNGLSTLFSRSGQITSTLIFNYYLYGPGVSGGQIVPMISQGYLYLGILFSSAISMASVALMYKYEEKIERAKGCYICNMFLGIVFAVAPIMYNYSIILVLLTSIVLPLYVTSLLNNINVNIRRKQ